MTQTQPVQQEEPAKNEPSSTFTKTLYEEKVKGLVQQLRGYTETIDNLKEMTDNIKNDMQLQITSYALSLKTTKFKREELEAFFRIPYDIQQHPKLKDTWLLAIPRFIDASFGWLESQTESFNHFAVNRYMDWLGELPAEVKRQIGMKDVPQLRLSGELLTGSKPALKDAWEKYKPFLKAMDEKGIIINSKRTFDLLAALVKDGILPFTPKPVDPADLVDPPRISADFKPRDYQLEAWKKFLEYSNIGVFFPPNIGKTWQAMWTMANLKGPHLVLVPSRILIDQWRDRLAIHTTLKEGVDYVVSTYQTGIKRYSDGMKVDGALKPWTLVVTDETHHTPANEFSKMALIKRKYTLGLSATPYREDGREEFIFAFSGFPVGMGWEHFRKLGLLKKPVCQVWLVKNADRKLVRLRELLKDEKKTLVFCDGIELGKNIAARFNIPHISGETTENRMQLIDQAFGRAPFAAVISRVGDEGISLPGIERIIEVDWLGRSRRQELQRHTRLLHGRQEGVEGENHILMTLDEYHRDHNRLYSLMDKGFAVKINSDEINERELERAKETPYRNAPSKRSSRDLRISEEAVPAAAIGGAIAGVTGLPGVKRILAGLTEGQQKLYTHLLNNDGKWFTQANLALLLGYSSPKSLMATIDVTSMVNRKLVQRTRTDEGQTAYRTNIASISGGAS